MAIDGGAVDGWGGAEEENDGEDDDDEDDGGKDYDAWAWEVMWTCEDC